MTAQSTSQGAHQATTASIGKWAATPIMEKESLRAAFSLCSGGPKRLSVYALTGNNELKGLWSGGGGEETLSLEE